jgi:hypothetical protein
VTSDEGMQNGPEKRGWPVKGYGEKRGWKRQNCHSLNFFVRFFHPAEISGNFVHSSSDIITSSGRYIEKTHLVLRGKSRVRFNGDGTFVSKVNYRNETRQHDDMQD